MTRAKKRAPARVTKRATRRGRIAATYAPEFLAALRHYYVETDKAVREIVVEFGITVGRFNRIVRNEGWPMRKDRPPRELPAAVKVLEEARALAERKAPALPLPLAGEGRGEGLVNHVERGVSAELPPPSPGLAPLGHPLPQAGEGEESAIDRLEKLVLSEIEAEEAARRQLGGAPRMAREAERVARRLSILTQTLHTLHRLRAPAIPDPMNADDDIPADIDEFRRDLARRIDAFVASRTEPPGAGRDSDVQAVDDPR